MQSPLNNEIAVSHLNWRTTTLNEWFTKEGAKARLAFREGTDWKESSDPPLPPALQKEPMGPKGARQGG